MKPRSRKLDNKDRKQRGQDLTAVLFFFLSLFLSSNISLYSYSIGHLHKDRDERAGVGEGGRHYYPVKNEPKERALFSRQYLKEARLFVCVIISVTVDFEFF